MVTTSFDYAVVDDEPAAHAVITSLMQRHPAFRLVGSYHHAADAELGLRRTPARLLFVDISMPGITGLELLGRLTASGRTPLPTTVLTTAYADKGLQAYDLGVRDYLLKPIAQDRLDLCIDRLMPLLAQPQAFDRMMAFSTGRGHRLFDLTEILAFEADGNFAWLITVNAKLMVSESLKSLQNRLRPFGFVRCHKRYLVNQAHIVEVRTSQIRLSDQMRIPVGDIYRASIEQILP